MRLIITLSKDVTSHSDALNIIKFVKEQIADYPKVEVHASVTTDLSHSNNHD